MATRAHCPLDCGFTVRLDPNLPEETDAPEKPARTDVASDAIVKHLLVEHRISRSELAGLQYRALRIS
ncbi:hypothetical protein GCM10027160_23820 [Streptomyces calidiresistens]|uniref:Uncharacterized protein n=1 Tax=Streptomyces calidiresistens TaxID=1485586 RepID=A0A7W3XY04_9ACTN|nr:hypothetical protein [Streptomyces calidiresistens]MBB0231367.1 hypothetical protein [Streptomyces calidiresistens]